MKKLFVDFDNTIINATKSFCTVYNFYYQNSPNYKPADWTKCNKWDLSDVCDLSKPCSKKFNNAEEIFSHPRFFVSAEFFDNTYEVLEELSEKYQIIICTIGTPTNISYKTIWIETMLPFITDVIYIQNQGCKMNKSIVNMGSNSIFIDDVSSNLFSSNANLKICYGKCYEWNLDWQGLRAKDWLSVKNMLLK